MLNLQGMDPTETWRLTRVSKEPVQIHTASKRRTRATEAGDSAAARTRPPGMDWEEAPAEEKGQNRIRVPPGLHGPRRRPYSDAGLEKGLIGSPGLFRQC